MAEFLEDMSLTPQEEEMLKTIWGQRELNLDFLIMPQWIPETLHKNREIISDTIYPFLQIINTSSLYTSASKVKFYHTSCGWIIHDYGDAMSSAPPHEMKEYLDELLAKSQGAPVSEAESVPAASGSTAPGGATAGGATGTFWGGAESGVQKKGEGGEEGGGEGGVAGAAGAGGAGAGGEGGVGTATAGGEDYAGTTIKQQADVAYLLIELAKKKGWSGVEMVAGTKLMQRYAWIAAQLQNMKLTNYSPSDEDRRSLEHVKELKKAIKLRPAVVLRPGEALTLVAGK